MPRFLFLCIFNLPTEEKYLRVIWSMDIRIRKSWFCVQVPSDLYSSVNVPHLKYETDDSVAFLTYLKRVLCKSKENPLQADGAPIFTCQPIYPPLSRLRGRSCPLVDQY